MSPRARRAPTSKVGAVVRALGVPRGVVTKTGRGRPLYVCGVCGATEQLDYTPQHAPPKWRYYDAFGWAQTGCAARLLRGIEAGHVQLGLEL